jgi:hypothetical protein
MNRELLRQYISAYKSEFSLISRHEIYKWRAVKQFQDTWDPEARDFAAMLSSSLSETHNLLAAAQYLPRRMIKTYAQERPKEVRRLFINLFDEEVDTLERIAEFRAGIKDINDQLHPNKNAYQDHRAILVYLNLRYPDTYFLYKYKMFKAFCERIEHDYKPRKHLPSQNVLQYLNLCSLVREELLADNELLTLHKDRLKETEYFDAFSNILTQDFIYAVVEYLKLSEMPSPAIGSKLTLKENNLSISQKQYQFVGKYVDHISRHRRNKYIGDLGEQIVLLHERKYCPPRFIDKIVHSAKSEGEGLGFDILSCDENGSEKSIEVKATKGSANKPFFISGTELVRSRIEGEKYFLYRLYNLDETNMTADYFIIQGDLSKYCINPTEYEVVFSS